MSGASSPDAVVVDTMVIGWLFDERPNLLADRDRDLIGSAGCCWPFTRCCGLPLL